MTSISETTETKRSQWLARISASLNDDYETTEYGKSKIKTVAFIDQNAPLCILSHMWNEYDTYANAALQWLRELGEHPNSKVRLSVANAVGQLAIYEFRPVRENVILPWAKSGKPSVQMLAAFALAKVAYDDDEDIAKQALNILRHWSGLSNSFHLRRTALAAYSEYVGLLFPQQALENIKVIIQSGDASLFPDIAQALLNLFNAGQEIEGLQLAVLSALEEWVKHDKKTSLHQLTLIVFWGLMSESKILQDQIQQPTLLWLAKKSKNAQEKVIFLLRNSLNLESTRGLVLDEILVWLKFVDKQQDFFKTIARIVFTLVDQGEYRERLRIFEYLKRWGEANKSIAASQVLSLITKHFEIK